MASHPRRAAGIWEWTRPLRRLKRRHRRYASSCFLAAGVAFGTVFYLVITRAQRAFDVHHLPLLALLVLLAVTLFFLGSNAEAEVSRIEAEIAEIEAEAVRALE